MDNERKSDEGCTDKCRLQHALLEVEIERNKVITEQMIKFPFCNECCDDRVEQGAVDSVKKNTPCVSHCGKRLFIEAKPLIKKYCSMDKKVKDLEDAIKIRQ